MHEPKRHYQHFSLNNLSDPFIENNCGVHSRQFEVVVLNWFAQLWEIENHEYWGYITYGSTKCNLHGILDSHYSVFKAARIYKMDFVIVDSLITAVMDCEDLKAKLLENRYKPATVNVNIGLAPKITFKKPIWSISVSDHKFVESSTPWGVQITRLDHMNAMSRNVEYIASRGATNTGSHSGYGGHQKEVQTCLRRAENLKDRLRSEGISVMLMRSPKDKEFIHRWQLACQGNIAHVVVMPSLTIKILNEFLNV
ncbi:hypothetical protein MKW92_040142 [Papaver armeniacum]|nr:hypothetical protein MKW92_040142 [Papaver armeniacum]